MRALSCITLLLIVGSWLLGVTIWVVADAQAESGLGSVLNWVAMVVYGWAIALGTPVLGILGIFCTCRGWPGIRRITPVFLFLAFLMAITAGLSLLWILAQARM